MVAPVGSPRDAAPPLAARGRRLLRRHGQSGGGDRCGPADGSVVRRQHHRVGQHDRDRAGRPVRRLRHRRPAGRPQPDDGRALALGRRRGRPAGAGAVHQRPVPAPVDQGVRRALRRAVRGLAARRRRADRRTRADAGHRLAVRRAPEDRPGLRRRPGRRTPLRDRHDRLADRHLPGLAPADPGRRHPAHVPDLRPRAGPGGAPRPGAPLAGGRGGGGRDRGAHLRPRRQHQGHLQHRQGHLGARDRVPVRPGHPAHRRRAAAGAQRGPGRALGLPRGRVAHGRLLGRDAGAALRRRAVPEEGGDPRQRGRYDGARDGALLPRRRRSTRSRSTPT